jgi:hypothetical protein
MNTKKNAFGAVALVAFTNLLVNIYYEIFEVVPINDAKASLFGHFPHGFAGAPGRVFDLFSYFTIWSQVVVVIAFYALYKNQIRKDRYTTLLLPTAIMMITITGIMFYALIYPVSPPEGANVYPSFVSHFVVPVLAVTVWLAIGPRGFMNVRVIPSLFIIPIIWVGLTLVRGIVSTQYPYGVLDVTDIGYMGFFITIIAIIIFGAILGLVYSALDIFRSKANR